MRALRVRFANRDFISKGGNLLDDGLNLVVAGNLVPVQDVETEVYFGFCKYF